MNRRTTIRNLLAVSAGMAALPAWAMEWTPDGLRNLKQGSFLNEAETEILSAVADTFIPRGEAIGALDVETDLFLVKLFTHCYETTVQENIRKQCHQLNVAAMQAFHKPFSACSQSEREGMLLAFPASGDASKIDFFELIKSETIRGFLTSRKVMREYSDFVVAPGHFRGCVAIETS